MGIIPSSDEYGDDCLDCYPAGKTPRLLKVFFSGIKIGSVWNPEDGMPPNGYWDLVQDSENPCTWWYSEDHYPTIKYIATNTYAWLSYEIGYQDYAFGQSMEPPCTTFFTTEFTSDWGLPFWDGTAEIITPAKMAEIVESVTPMIDPDPRMELFVNSDSHVVIRYAGKRDATNIQIEVDTSI